MMLYVVKWPRRWPAMALAFLLVGGVATSSQAATTAVLPGQVRVDATPNHLGVVWYIDGDSDLDSSFLLEFRKLGSASWQPGAPAMRTYPTIIVNGSPLGLNYWAASALFVESGASYELRITLSDPDGGGEQRIVAATVATVPTTDPTGRRRYVQPGSGGGTGSSADPFLGLQAAADAAQPGDVFEVATGRYQPFTLEVGGAAGRPISSVGPDEGAAVVDGRGTDRGVLTIGRYDRTTGHVLIRGLTIQNGAWGVDAQNTHDLLIERNLIRDVDFGVYNRRGNGWEHDQIVCDNIIQGRTPWPGVGIPGERGIHLQGTANVVCHNQVQWFGDCISVQPSTAPSFGNDVFGNDVSYCVDDGIEIDYNQASARVWRNRVYNARMGVSLQPIRGGPAYVFRNESSIWRVCPTRCTIKQRASSSLTTRRPSMATDTATTGPCGVTRSSATI